MVIEIYSIVLVVIENIVEIIELLKEMVKNIILDKREIIKLVEIVRIVVDNFMILLYILGKNYLHHNFRVHIIMQIILIYVYVLVLH